MIRLIKDAILRSAQIPANMVAALAMEHPALAAKFLPFSSSKLCYVLPKAQLSSNALDELPVPPPERWEGYGPSAKEYLELGRAHLARTLDLCKEGGYEFKKGDRILEFGCAAGRMMRWLRKEAAEGEVWGTDINAQHILWAQQHLSPPFKFLTNTTLPHLPFPDGYFNLIYAGSVFSHVADLADAWLLELGRVLAPGGKLFVTICDRNTAEALMTRHSDSAWANIVRPYYQKVKRTDPDFEMFTIRRSPQGAQVFYNSDFFVRKLSPTFRLVSLTPEAYGIQTGVLAEKR